MDAKDFRSNDGGDWKTVENIDEGLPNFDVTPTLALIIEPIHCKRN